MPSLPRVTRCCCCCTLQMGVLVLGWLTLVGSILNIISVIKELATFQGFESIIHDIDPECDWECVQSMNNFVKYVSIASLFLDAILICISALLIYGVRKDRPRLMTPYVIYLIISVGLICVSFIAGIVMLAQAPLAAFIFAIVIGLCLLFTFYFLIVIKSYQLEVYDKLKNAPIRLQEEGGFATVTSGPDGFVPIAAGQGDFAPVQGGYTPGQVGYSAGQTGYPAGQTGYPGPPTGYPSQSVYPAGQAVYPTSQAGYPTGQAGYPTGQAGYPTGQGTYAPEQGGLKAAPGSAPIGMEGYGGGKQ